MFLGESQLEVTLQSENANGRPRDEPISKQKLKDAYNYLSKAIALANQFKKDEVILCTSMFF